MLDTTADGVRLGLLSTMGVIIFPPDSVWFIALQLCEMVWVNYVETGE